MPAGLKLVGVISPSENSAQLKQQNQNQARHQKYPIEMVWSTFRF
jgi:hypothetical protein